MRLFSIKREEKVHEKEFEEHLKNISVEEQSKHQKEDSRAFTTIQVEPETETAYYCTICGKKRTQN